MRPQQRQKKRRWKENEAPAEKGSRCSHNFKKLALAVMSSGLGSDDCTQSLLNESRVEVEAVGWLVNRRSAHTKQYTDRRVSNMRLHLII